MHIAGREVGRKRHAAREGRQGGWGAGAGVGRLGWAGGQAGGRQRGVRGAAAGAACRQRAIDRRPGVACTVRPNAAWPAGAHPKSATLMAVPGPSRTSSRFSIFKSRCTTPLEQAREDGLNGARQKGAARESASHGTARQQAPPRPPHPPPRRCSPGVHVAHGADDLRKDGAGVRLAEAAVSAEPVQQRPACGWKRSRGGLVGGVGGGGRRRRSEAAEPSLTAGAPEQKH